VPDPQARWRRETADIGAIADPPVRSTADAASVAVPPVDVTVAGYLVRNRGLDTSPDLVDYTAKRTDIAMDRYRTFAASHPDQSRYFQPILDVLDYAPSKLELVPAVVMVEGKNDYYSARLAQHLLGVESTVQFMPGGGAGTLDQLIALYIGWGREFVVSSRLRR
jgi:hypothetical protein